MTDHTILTMEVGPLGTNCYVVVCNATQQAAVIDPGGSPQAILEQIEKRGWQVKAVINTHGHFDHVMGNQEIMTATGAPLYLHEDDVEILREAPRDMAQFMPPHGDPGTPTVLLHEGDTIQVGNLSFQVIHTPGHTPGGICLLLDKDLICGDTLFAGSIGRTDLRGGNYPQIIQSIQEKIMPLPDDVVAYPGHGPATTIGRERQINPYVRR